MTTASNRIGLPLWYSTLTWDLPSGPRLGIWPFFLTSARRRVSFGPAWAVRRNALVFLDIQVGKSTLAEELPRLEKFLSRPNFHLGIDPEFSMKNGGIPGKRIGTYDAEDVNYASRFLQDIVTRHKLTPKVLVVHRFTRKGVTNTPKIKLDPRVQVVMHMDGFGSPRLKRATFRPWIKAEPVQFVGWKQFYKSRNDNPRTTIAEILRLFPRPLYIQYQ